MTEGLNRKEKAYYGTVMDIGCALTGRKRRGCSATEIFDAVNPYYGRIPNGFALQLRNGHPYAVLTSIGQLILSAQAKPSAKTWLKKMGAFLDFDNSCSDSIHFKKTDDGIVYGLDKNGMGMGVVRAELDVFDRSKDGYGPLSDSAYAAALREWEAIKTTFSPRKKTVPTAHA